MNLINDNNKNLKELIKINESLNSINIIEPKIINKNNNIYKNNIRNNYIQNNSSLNEIFNINKGIDSIYDNIKLMKGNKINSKILYNINNYTQTSEED